MSFDFLKSFILSEARARLNLLSEGKSESYSDEHAHAHVWNHMVHLGIAHDKEAMFNELHKAKIDPSHKLHFNNISSDGFVGKKKTPAAHDSYHAELETAVHTVHALANHPHFKNAISEKHVARVMGGAKGEVSDIWKKHGATKGATSKADISIFHPSSKSSEGIRLSMKKGVGSQLMSAGPEENKAVHDYATRDMLNNHPKYKNLSTKQKEEIHSNVMKHMDKVTKHLNAMKTMPRETWEYHKNQAQKALDHIHDLHPELNHYVRKEATTGRGKFGEKSPFTASYLVKSATGKKGVKIVHVDEHDYDGPRPRAALPKGEGRSGNVKSDEV